MLPRLSDSAGGAQYFGVSTEAAAERLTVRSVSGVTAPAAGKSILDVYGKICINGRAWGAATTFFERR
jgi:hypothetical protein